MDWDTDGRDWPHRDASRFVDAGGLRWHVQHFPGPRPDAPSALLLHGTGASTHTWRDVAPALAGTMSVWACDLPGHAFTGLPPEGARSPLLSLPGMAGSVAELLRTLGVQPALLVGHSAGAAVAVRMVLDGAVAPRAIVSFNGALLPLRGLAGRIFSPAARLMAAAPGVPALFAWRAAQPRVLQQLLDATGSRLDATGTALYGQLVRQPAHAAGALGMMAQWDLPSLAQALPRLSVPLHLVVGSRDETVPPRDAHRLHRLLPDAARRPVHVMAALGHLAHEERPDDAAALVLAALAQP